MLLGFMEQSHSFIVVQSAASLCITMVCVTIKESHGHEL